MREDAHGEQAGADKGKRDDDSCEANPHAFPMQREREGAPAGEAEEGTHEDMCCVCVYRGFLFYLVP